MRFGCVRVCIARSLQATPAQTHTRRTRRGAWTWAGVVRGSQAPRAANAGGQRTADGSGWRFAHGGILAFAVEQRTPGRLCRPGSRARRICPICLRGGCNHKRARILEWLRGRLR